jgi:hypothetical protein
MSDQEMKDLQEDVTTLKTVLLGTNGTPGFAQKFDAFVVEWRGYVTKGRFEDCPYLKKRATLKWGTPIMIGVLCTLLTLGINVVLKVMHI